LEKTLYVNFIFGLFEFQDCLLNCHKSFHLNFEFEVGK